MNVRFDLNYLQKIILVYKQYNTLIQRYLFMYPGIEGPFTYKNPFDVVIPYKSWKEIKPTLVDSTAGYGYPYRLKKDAYRC
jgi:hypothetical protein